MVIHRNEMKRKRRDDCSSPILDDSPKRTKVHAQRKFAQGSNVNSPVITPVKELEKQETDVLPEPVELLPIKRPNTEDFLTFLCFRGTPILPPSLNFFNTASIVDTNGQVHEIKSESPKNGPIDTCAITKTGSGSSERPFVAFGVRKRADPIVISRQMDKKRRHALALQALRRKYQEQRMAKIRAVTISKLSEKVTSKTIVRSNSVVKTETVSKRSGTLQKTKESMVSTKHIKVTTQTVKSTLRPQIKQKMCLRSFRGRFVQKELQFRNIKKRPLPIKKINKNVSKKTEREEAKQDVSEEESEDNESSSDDEKPLIKTSKELKFSPRVILPKIAKKSAPGPKKPSEINFRITRSNKFLNNKVTVKSNKVSTRRQQIKQRMIMSTPKTIVKPRTLRSNSALKSLLSPDKKIVVKRLKTQDKQVKQIKVIQSTEIPKKSTDINETKKVGKDNLKKENKNVNKSDTKPVVTVKKIINKPLVSSIKKPIVNSNVKTKLTQSSNIAKKDIKPPEIPKKDIKPPEKSKSQQKPVSQPVEKKVENDNQIKKEETTKKISKPAVVTKKVTGKLENVLKKEVNVNKKEIKPNTVSKDIINVDTKETIESKASQRPTRKTKEAAAIYMEILSHKLVNESKIDDDNVSIDSFPELPNVKKTEQRENELKAKAKSTRTKEGENASSVKSKTKDKDSETIESKSLRSGEKKIGVLPKKESCNVKKDEKNDIKKKEESSQKNKNEQLEIQKCLDEKSNSVSDESKKTNSKSMKPLIIKEKSPVCDRKTRLSNIEKPMAQPIPSIEKCKDVELKVKLNPLSLAAEDKKLKDLKETSNEARFVETSESVIKKKNVEKTLSKNELESDDSQKVVKAKRTNIEKKSKSTEVVKRLTRSSSQATTQIESDDSDESFRIDIKIPRKKLITRSKSSALSDSDTDFSNKSTNKSDIKKSLRTSARSYKECTFTDSDFSTTSDVDIKPVNTVPKNKKLCKIKPKNKSESFSESDEEPLSKFTQNKSIENKESVKVESETAKSEKKTPNPKQTETQTKKAKEKTDVKIEEKEHFSKPKRECAKRPQNYLPMFSSSDEDDFYFQGFKTKTETPLPNTNTNAENTCPHIPTTSDLSCKDIGRRFGKGKVNMSNEQIEKWLKDSAMAGNSVKNENDAMLKFGEKIPTDTLLQVTSCIDTNKLKTLLINALEKEEANTEKKVASDTSPKTDDKVQLTKNISKPAAIIDRKLIFRNKDKVSAVPNVNAFSVSNESSVYAFGEDNDEVMKTPFRRPSRRPSSTATSKSEDESSKLEDLTKPGQFRKPSIMKQELKPTADHVEENTTLETDDSEHQFYTPLQPSKPLPKAKPTPVSQKGEENKPTTSSMVPPSPILQKTRDVRMGLKQQPRNFDKNADISEEYKYKVPSSPSASSSSSAKLYKRQNCKPKLRAADVVPVKFSEFPANSATHHLVEAPTFYPTEKEFQDPLEFIEKIRAKAEQFGICRIVPPPTFKPECKVTDDMRFTAYNQYVHKMLHRWGPNFKELMAIKKYLSTQNINLTHPPWIGGMEIDLPRLYQTVQTLGGLKEVIEKKKWPKVSDLMKIPKSAQDRVTKLDDIYCKYLLPYDTLSPDEREKLFDEVETDWAKRESKSLLKAQQNINNEEEESENETDDEAEECITKGRSMALNAFYRIARNTMSMWFKTAEPSAQEVEQEFWKHVTLKQNHICVHSGSIDSGNWGYGFAVSKNSPFARHAWNLKVLTNNSGSVLRSLGPIMGVTVPTLHVGMVFSSCSWYRDPHSLPWIEYLHTGGNKIWYGIPDSTSSAFHTALKKLVPNYCRNKTLWLPSDTVMVPPSLLIENRVSLCRIVQEPGQFIVVFPKVFTSSLSTGYVVSESVYFAPSYWLNTARGVFDDLRNSCEQSMFSLDRLLLSIVNDPRSNVDVLRQIIPAVTKLCDTEKLKRVKIKSLGITSIEKLPLPEAPNIRKKKKMHGEDGDYECEICRMNLFLSLVSESEEDTVYCLDHAIEQVEKENLLAKNCKLMYTYDDDELAGIVDRIISAIESKMQKKLFNKYSGMPTLLTK